MLFLELNVIILYYNFFQFYYNLILYVFHFFYQNKNITISISLIDFSIIYVIHMKIKNFII